MDERTFTVLVKRFGMSTGRRPVLGLVLALLAEGMRGNAPAVEAKKKKGAKCKANQKKCGKRCIRKTACCTSANCPAGSGKTCQQGRCACPGGKTEINGNSVPAGSICDPVCGPCHSCVGNACVTQPDETVCGDDDRCLAGVCHPRPVFGCTTELNQCTSSGSVLCPDFPSGNCFVTPAGNPICGGAGACGDETTDAECVVLRGAGARSFPCSFCSNAPGGFQNVCISPAS